jgi:flagellar basal body-associated protein FliL
MMKKKVILVLLVLIIVAVFCYAGASWWKTRQAQIKMGIASDKFPYRLYTQEELNKMYPQIKNADVPTRVTPEQTYANFREALRTNNLDMAIEQLSKDSEKYEENKKTLEEAYKDGKFVQIYNEYSEKIEKEYMAEAIAQFYFIEEKDGEKTSYPIDFIKDSNGDWKLDSL